MISYFGYGSNLSVVSLRAKGVTPLWSEPARLEGWSLAFNIPDFFAIEGGTGNIVPSPSGVVHGVLHVCRSADLAKLDQLEAVGVTYRRHVASVTTYVGRRADAYVYVGLDALLDDRCLPSERYRNILIAGARSMRLAPAYVEWLEQLPTCPKVERATFAPAVANLATFSLDAVAARPDLTALAGFVFDMTSAPPRHRYLRKLLGGRDATLLFLRRMDTSAGDETFGDISLDRLSAAQRAYLNAYLHEFAREYQLVGRVAYDATAPAVHLVDPSGQSDRRLVAAAPVREVPARAVLNRAAELREALGHDNLGTLSETHGFVARESLAERLPASHAAWDEVVAELPTLYRTLGLRRAVDALPLLPADAEHLPDAHLLRAAAVLGFLSHAYQYVESRPAAGHPAVLETPWRTVRERLGRGPAAVLTYQDLIVNNWRLVDRTRPDPMVAPNMRLLFPTVDTNEERTFYLTQTEILSRATPIVAAVVRAQEAVAADDAEALEASLLVILGTLDRIVRESLLRIDPNAWSASYVDPVVWAKTVAPFAVPFQKGVQGPSGTSSPIFNVLDVFLGRKRFETFLGREIVGLRDTYPPLWQELILALQDVSVPEYVARRGDPHLEEVFRETTHAYVGENGFLGRHRMKVYGYLELAFKVGRSVTIGGFSGVFKDRTWDQVDTELERSRLERAASMQSPKHRAVASEVRPATDGGGVLQVRLAVPQMALPQEPGARLGVLTENEPELVARTVAALGASAEAPVHVTAEWREALAQRGLAADGALPLARFLTFAKIRPLLPRAAEGLHAISQSPALRAALESGRAERFELWDVLQALRTEGFDPTRLLDVDEATGTTRLAHVLPPETFRMYSVATATATPETRTPGEIGLTVGRLKYASESAADGAPVARSGSASNFFARAAGRELPVVLETPPRFLLPRSVRTPLVLVAGGTGIAPFRAFLRERHRHEGAGVAVLLLGVRSRDDFAFGEELEPYLRSGMLSLHVAFSRDDVTLGWTPNGGYAWLPGQRRRVPDLLADPAIAGTVHELLLPTWDGGGGAHVYVCGRARFARAALDGIQHVLERFASGASDEERRAEGRARFFRLFAEGRFAEETFSGDATPEGLPHIPFSEVAVRNDDPVGRWMVLEGKVYDLGDFIDRHPGGARVLAGYLGMDATEGYRRAHSGKTEIDATRDMYLLGVVKPLELGTAHAAIATPQGERIVSLAAVHRAWLGQLGLVVEMQNALRNDHALQRGVTTRGEAAGERTLFKLQRSVETHERFLRSYLDVLRVESFEALWTLTRGYFDPSRPASEVRERLGAAARGPAMTFVSALPGLLYEALDDLAGTGAGPADPAFDRVARAVTELELADASLLAALKAHLVEGVRAFETHEALTAERAGVRLVELAAALPTELERFAEALWLTLSQREGFVVGTALPPALPSDRSLGTATLFASRHWVVEEEPARGLVMLRRTPVPFASLDELVAQNDSVMACIRAEHASYGVVVDMRQAPQRNDPDFENAMRKLRETMHERFARLAVLLQSNVGVLQVSRIARGDGDTSFVTMSEGAAIRFARNEA